MNLIIHCHHTHSPPNSYIKYFTINGWSSSMIFGRILFFFMDIFFSLLDFDNLDPNCYANSFCLFHSIDRKHIDSKFEFIQMKQKKKQQQQPQPQFLFFFLQVTTWALVDHIYYRQMYHMQKIA